MSSGDVLLTISILVSGKPENVHRCLESLRDLREKVSCELLITDTGCPQETREVIERYADEIIPFVWCKDFSEARNVGLQRAKGKWFMFLDDDEWFEDVQEIADFFVNGEYRNYHHAFYYQRNYNDFQGSEYSDAPVLRMMEKTTDTKFMYSIHECLCPVRNPGKYFGCYVHHYGYVYNTREERLAKAQRNIELLLVEQEQHPWDLHHIFQLAQEYGAIGDYEQSLRVSEMGIAIWEKHHKKSGRMVRYVNSLYANVLQCLLLQKEYVPLVEHGDAYLNEGDADPLVTALMQARMAVAYYELKEYEKCQSCVGEYYDAFLLWKKQPEYYYPYESSLTKPCFERNLLQVVLQCGICAALKEGLYEKAKIYALAVDWCEGIAYMNPTLIRELVKLLNEVEEQKVAVLVAISNKLLERRALETYFADGILEQESPCWSRYALLEGEHAVFMYARRCVEGKGDREAEEEQLDALRLANLYEQLERCQGDINFIKERMHSYVALEGAAQGSLAYFFAGVLKAMEQADWKEAVRILKEINVQYPEMGKLVRLLLEEIGNKANEEQNPNREFAALAVAVKKQAEMLIISGQAGQARAILMQLKQMLPDDGEISEMLDKCN